MSGIFGFGFFLPNGGFTFTPVEGGGGGDGGGLLFNSGFKANSYSVGGSPVALLDMWGENTDWGAFQDESVVPGTGLTAADVEYGSQPVLTGAAFAAVVAAGGASLVYDVVVDLDADPAASVFSELVSLPGYETDSGWVANPDGVKTYTGDGQGSPLPVLPTGSHTIRATLTPTKASVSIDGGAVATQAGTNVLPVTALGIYFNSTGIVVERVRGYSPVADADLPTLGA